MSPPSRFVTGLVGRDIGASRSPMLHEREADAHGVRLVYPLHDFAADGRGEADLGPLLAAARLLGVAGLNVTHPYKQAVIPHLDRLSDGARAVGSVNTVAFHAGEAVGHNTDVIGFAEGMRHGLPDARLDRVVQMGAGGAGFATAQALLGLGAGEVVVFDTDAARADTLVGRLREAFGRTRASRGGDLAAALAGAQGVVNATPLGMARHPGSAVPAALLRPELWVADIVYFPLETELLRTARLRGCRTLDGGYMVVFQAAAAFGIFTGLPADPMRMLRSFRESLDQA